MEEYTDLIEHSKFEILKRDPSAFQSKIVKLRNAQRLQEHDQDMVHAEETFQ